MRYRNCQLSSNWMSRFLPIFETMWRTSSTLAQLSTISSFRTKLIGKALPSTPLREGKKGNFLLLFSLTLTALVVNLKTLSQFSMLSKWRASLIIHLRFESTSSSSPGSKFYKFQRVYCKSWKKSCGKSTSKVVRPRGHSLELLWLLAWWVKGRQTRDGHSLG